MTRIVSLSRAHTVTITNRIFRAILVLVRPLCRQFEKEVGYRFRPEYIIDQGYYNNQYRVPSKEYKDFQAFQRREVTKLAKEMVDITHECGKEAMMFLGDHWI